MRKTFCTLKGLILVAATIGVVSLPGISSADAPSQGNHMECRYCLGNEEIGAGATPLLGKMSIPEYRDRQAIVQSSSVALNLDLNPKK